MAVRIRLMRLGSKRKPFYRLVVVDSRGKRDGGFLDQIGHYNPISKPEEIRVDEEKLFGWLGKGAGLSDGARSILKRTGALNRWKSLGTQAGEPGVEETEVALEENASRQEPLRQEAEETETDQHEPGKEVEAGTEEQATP